MSLSLFMITIKNIFQFSPWIPKNLLFPTNSVTSLYLHSGILNNFFKGIGLSAVSLLILGTFFVLFFADPTVSAIAALANTLNLSPFYVSLLILVFVYWCIILHQKKISFIITPAASNFAELLNSYYFAKNKSKKTLSLK